VNDPEAGQCGAQSKATLQVVGTRLAPRQSGPQVVMLAVEPAHTPQLVASPEVTLALFGNRQRPVAVAQANAVLFAESPQLIESILPH